MTDLQVILIMLAGLVVNIVMMINLLRRLIKVEVGLEIIQYRKEITEALRHVNELYSINREMFKHYQKEILNKGKFCDDEY